MAVFDNVMHVYIVVIKLLVFLVTNAGSGYITWVDELEVILQDVFAGELLHTKAAILRTSSLGMCHHNGVNV